MKSASNLPKSVQAVLWSYSLENIDLETHKRLIISNVLNLGTKDATDWLFAHYERSEIAQEANLIPSGQWNKRSLQLWSLVLGIRPQSKQALMAVV